MRLISQLINGISRVFQTLPKYFNGTFISTSFVLPSARAFPFITTSMSIALCISVLFILLLQLVNGAQFLNITSLFLSPACLAAA